MNITISYNSKDNIPNFIKAFKIRFALRYRYTFIWAIFVGIAGIVTLVTGSNSDGFIGLGVALLYLSFFYLLSAFRVRSKSLKVYDVLRFDTRVETTIISFTDDLFIYNDHQCRYEIKWSFFQGYFIRDGFIFIVQQGVLNAFSISIGLFKSDADVDELKAFLAAKVPQYKINGLKIK